MFLLDSNVFIQAKNFHYGFDFCPGFWSWLDQANQAGTVFSVEGVADELRAGGDDLTEWVRARPALFLAPDAATVASLQIASTWASAAGYTQAAVGEFLQAADYYLVAHAHAHRFTVVTHEKAEDTVRKVKIPNACGELRVQCITPWELLRGQGARFVLEV